MGLQTLLIGAATRAREDSLVLAVASLARACLSLGIATAHHTISGLLLSIVSQGRLPLVAQVALATRAVTATWLHSSRGRRVCSGHRHALAELLALVMAALGSVSSATVDHGLMHGSGTR